MLGGREIGLGNENEEKSRLEMENVNLREELKRLRREYENLTETKIRVEEEKKLLVGREKRSEERYNKLNEELLNEQSERSKAILGMKREIEKLKNDLEASERSFEVLNKIWSPLEVEISAKTGFDVSVVRKMVENGGVDWIANSCRLDSCSPHRTPTSSKSTMKDPSAVVVLIDSEEDDDVKPTGGRAALSKAEKPSTTRTEEKKEKEPTKKLRISTKKKRDKQLGHGTKKPRKSCLVPTNDQDDTRHEEQAVEKAGTEQHNETMGLVMAAASDDSDDDLESQNRSRSSWPWLFETDMYSALEEDVELCMNAICALYRQQNSQAKSSSECLDKGLDIARVAKYLTQDHPEKKLNTSVTEVCKETADDCKRLALHYRKELFRIYCSSKDPFFCYSALSSKF